MGITLSKGAECLYDKIKAGVDQIIAEFKEANADGQVEFKEVVGILALGLGHCVKLVGAVAGYTNEERRECMLKCAERLVDEVLIPWDIPGIPNWIEGPADRVLRSAILGFAPAIVDALVRLLDTVDDWIPIPGPIPIPDIDDGRIFAMCALPPGDVAGCDKDNACDCDGAKDQP